MVEPVIGEAGVREAEQANAVLQFPSQSRSVGRDVEGAPRQPEDSWGFLGGMLHRPRSPPPLPPT